MISKKTPDFPHELAAVYDFSLKKTYKNKIFRK